MVELKRDTIVRGTLAEADELMNLLLENVSYEPLQARCLLTTSAVGSDTCTATCHSHLYALSSEQLLRPSNS